MTVALLRAATREAHLAIEARSPMSRLMADDLLLADYGALLTGLATLYRSIDPALALAARRFMPAIEVPARALLAEQDLRALGLAPAARRADAWIGALDDVSRFVGALYVVEGSALGGRTIAARLLRAGQVPAVALQFLTLGGSASPAWRWREVSAACDRAFAEGADLLVAIATARQAFAWFDEPLRACMPAPAMMAQLPRA